MLKKTFLRALFFIIVLSSCTFDFSEDYYKEIEITQPTASLTLSSFENNMTLTQPVNVNYLYNGANKHRLYEIDISIDNKLILSDSYENGTFYIDVNNLEETTHKLKVEYYFSSGTGSLADVANLEAYVVTQEYTFLVDKSIGVAPNMLDVEILNGTLFISWDILKHSDFNEAYLIIENGNNQHINQILLTNDELYSGIYNDKLSVTNSLKYSIMLKNYYTSSISNKVAIEIPKVSIETEILNENQHVMRWSSHALYGNFDYYKYSNYGYSDEILDSKGGELIFDKSPIFGEKIHHYLYMYRGEQQVGSITATKEFGKPFSTILANEYVYSSKTNSYFALKTVGEDYYEAIQELYLYQLDPINLSVLSKMRLDNVVASTYRNLIIDPVSNSLIVDTEEKSYKINASDLSILKTWNIEDYNFNGYSTRPHYRNGFMYIADFSGSGYFNIYNAESKTLIYSGNINYYFKVSDDGKYFYNQDAIYKIENNNVVLVTSTDTGSSIHTIGFLLDQNKCIYSNVNSNPVIYDFNTQNKTVLNEIIDVNDIQYDQTSGKVFFGQLHTDSFGGHKSFANIYNLNSGTLKRLQIYDSHYVGVYFRYLNNKLIYSWGLYLDTYINQ